MNKLTAILLTTAMSLSGSAYAGEKLVVSSFYPMDMVSGWNGLVDAFKESHPGVDVEVQITPLSQYLQKLTSQIAGGDSPDVSAVENSPFPQFVSRNILEDLTPYLEKTPDFSLEDFFPVLIDRYSVDGRIYGIPYDAQPRAMMFYNPAMFAAAGVDVPTSDWNWEDFRLASKTIADASGDEQQYGACLSMNADESWVQFVYNGGGTLVDDNRNPTKATMDQPAAVEASKFWLDMMFEDKSMPTMDSLEAMGQASQACKTLFLNNRSAMIIAGIWLAIESPQAFKDLGAKMVMAPVKDTENRVYPTGGTAYTILKSSKNKELAWEFLTQFLGRTGYEEAYKEAPLGAIYPPAHLPSYEWYARQDLEFVDSMEPNQQALEHIRFAPYLLNWSEIDTTCVKPEIDLMARQLSEVEPTLAKIAACVDSKLGD